MALAYHGISYIFNRGMPLLAVIASAQVLEASQFGLLVGTISFFSTALLLVDAGLSLAVTTRTAALVEERGELLRRSVCAAVIVCATLGGVMAIAIAAIPGPLSGLMFGRAGHADLILAGIVYVPSAALAIVIGGALQGLQRYRDQAAISVLSGGVHMVAVVAFASIMGTTGAIWAASASMALRAAFMLQAIWPFLRWPADLRLLGNELAHLTAIAAPACAAAIAMIPVGTMVISALFRHANGPAEAGAFGAAMQFFALAMIVPSILTQFALPRMAQLNMNTSAARAADPRTTTPKTLALRYAAFAIAGAALIAIPVMIFSGFILSLFGESYASNAQPLQLMMLAAIVAAPQGVLSNFLLATKRNWLRVATMYAWPLVVSAFLLSGQPSATDAAGAYVAAWAALTLIQALMVALGSGPPAESSMQNVMPRH